MKFWEGFEKRAVEAKHITLGLGLGRKEKMSERDKKVSDLAENIADREHSIRMGFHPYHPVGTALGAAAGGVAAGAGAEAAYNHIADKVYEASRKLDRAKDALEGVPLASPNRMALNKKMIEAEKELAKAKGVKVPKALKAGLIAAPLMGALLGHGMARWNRARNLSKIESEKEQMKSLDKIGPSGPKKS